MVTKLVTLGEPRVATELKFGRVGESMLTGGGRPKKGKLEPAIVLMLEGKLE